MLSAIILAAGSSSRMGGVNKQFLELGGVPVLVRSVQAFLWEGEAEEILVVCRREDWDAVDGLVGHLPKVRVVPAGGETRQQSVENALRYLYYPLCDRIAIHDGARPLVRPEDIGKTVAAAKETGAAVLGVMAKDTIKVVEKGRVISTPDRSGLFVTQTPQVFDLARYREALTAAKEAGARPHRRRAAVRADGLAGGRRHRALRQHQDHHAGRPAGSRGDAGAPAGVGDGDRGGSVLMDFRIGAGV